MNILMLKENDMKNFYGCPVCHARHSTKAWTFKTRKELGLDNLDEMDIVHMNDIETILDSKNTFNCPSCEIASLAKDIYNYENEKNKTNKKWNLKNVFINLQINPEMTAYIHENEEEPKDVYKISCQEGEWLISTPELEGCWDSFGDMDEATEYLMKNLSTSFFAKYN